MSFAQLMPRLASGEVHYWRVDPSAWAPLLHRVEELGLPSVASYVQWELHEHEPGRFDFTGRTDPRRNLLRYLELVVESGLGLIIRPGPYTFAEWRNYGVPEYVAPHHRLHPEFQAAAGHWIDAVCEVLLPFLETRGGPIFLVQADNMFDIGQNRYDRALGLLGGGGPFGEFLARKYGNVAVLNDVWESRYTSFDEPVATMARHDDSSPPQRYRDFVEFRTTYTEEAARWTVARYRAAGVDVPLYSNATADQSLAGMSKVLDLVGLNHYPTRDYAPPGEHRELLTRIRLADAVTPAAYLAELEAGMWHGFHYTKGVPYAEHYWFMLTTILAGGARGWNWYMLHDRDNWYLAPYNERAEPRAELVEVFRASTELWRRIEPWRWRRVSDVGLTLWRQGIGAEGPSLSTVAAPVADALYEAGIDHVVVDLRRDGATPPLVFHGGGELGEEEVEALVRFVEGGGHLVVWNTFELGRDAATSLGIEPPDGAYAQGYMDTFHKDLELQLASRSVTTGLPRSVGVYREPPGEPIHGTLRAPRRVISDNILGEYAALTQLGDGERLSVGYRRRVADGFVTVLAVPPTPELVTALVEFMGVRIPARPLTRATHASLFERDGRHYLVVLNLGGEETAAVVSLDRDIVGNGALAVEDLVRGGDAPDPILRADNGVVVARVPGRNGTVLELRAR